MSKALILSVGMSVESEIFAIKEINPGWVAFVCTHGSRKKLDEIVEQTGLQPSQYQTFEVTDDALKIGDLVAQAHAAYQWVREKVGPKGEVTINPTAGRKWMSTGMTLFAGQTVAKIVYVDVDFKGGKPVPETMRIVRLGNPDDSTGFLKAQEPVVLFNRGDFEGAVQGFAQLQPTLAAPRRLYSGLRDVSAALVVWERFEHYAKKKRHKSLFSAVKEVKEAALELNMTDLVQWSGEVETLARRIERVQQGDKPSLDAVADLYHNAQRKLRQGRYEDAVARLYRALEAIAQWMLHQKNVNSSKVDWSMIPEEAQVCFRNNQSDNSRPLTTKLGLMDSFALARALGCKGVEDFFNDQGFCLRNEIEIRNQSILAHGWTPVEKKRAEKFRDAVREVLLQLGADLEGWDVPKLPTLWS